MAQNVAVQSLQGRKILATLLTCVLLLLQLHLMFQLVFLQELLQGESLPTCTALVWFGVAGHVSLQLGGSRAAFAAFLTSVSTFGKLLLILECILMCLLMLFDFPFPGECFGAHWTAVNDETILVNDVTEFGCTKSFCT